MPRTAARSLVHAGILLLLVAACSGRGKPEGAAPARPTTPTDASSVSAEEISRTPSESFEKQLQGRVAGVVVSRTPEGGIAVRVRGASSMYGNNEPLYVLDGMPFTPGMNGALTGINPYDIESIKVLKDPAETAMYGSRGANGVIIIKTKRPPPAPPKP